MITEITALVRVHVLGNWPVVVAVVPLAIAAATYLITSIAYLRATRSTKNGRAPPTVPYWLPVVGSTLEFVVDIEKFIKRVQTKYGDDKPYTVKLLGRTGKFNLIMKPADYSAILRSTKYTSNKLLMAEVMEKVFGTPQYVMPMYRRNVSGISPTPIPGTNVPEHQRIWHNQHASSAKYLVGDSLRNLGARYVSSLSEALAVANPNDPVDSGEWVAIADFYPWWRSRVFTAATTALFGPHLIRLNPTLEADFWAFIDVIPMLGKSYPRWMVLRAYAARDKMIAAMKKWHAFARAHADYRDCGNDAPDWDEYWGSVWLKVRQRWGQDTGIMDDDGLASEDLGLLMAANANAILMAFWNLIEVYKDRALLARVLPELRSGVVSLPGQSPMAFDLGPILSSPLLQSIYAEVLRMRISLMVTRIPERGVFRHGPWNFEHGAFIALPSGYVGYHEGAWAELTAGGQRPVSEFWAESDGEGKAQKDRFSTDHVEGIWMPYGGGAVMCPGRHLAKQEMIGGVTVFAAYYELEVAEGWVPKMDPFFYGVGAQQPAEPTPVRIRRGIGRWMKP
ncbi:hypothetical protein MFIFM68171_08436 [Madurella fahalii]|uniref:Cytochrome P450 n=1 Tax=Madurella fahalii TaxID=1157608 RepID=A0ABQ0GKE4_9PEZI